MRLDPVDDSGDPPIRRALPRDAKGIADLFWTVRTESIPHIPPLSHPRESVEPFIRDVLLGEFEVWLAEAGHRPVGFMALMQPDQLVHLYIAAQHRDQGLGSRFVGLAQRRFPAGLQLWTFQSNLGARRFYERHDFVAVEWTDRDNEEGAPDVRMVWRPADQ